MAKESVDGEEQDAHSEFEGFQSEAGEGDENEEGDGESVASDDE